MAERRNMFEFGGRDPSMAPAGSHATPPSSPLTGAAPELIVSPAGAKPPAGAERKTVPGSPRSRHAGAGGLEPSSPRGGGISRVSRHTSVKDRAQLFGAPVVLASPPTPRRGRASPTKSTGRLNKEAPSPSQVAASQPTTPTGRSLSRHASSGSVRMSRNTSGSSLFGDKGKSPARAKMEVLTKSAHGLDQARRNAKAYEYLCHLEEAKRWVAACISEELPSVSQFEEELATGVALAKLACFFSPKTVLPKHIYDPEWLM